MGLDERPRDPLHRMGVGHNISERALEEVTQLHPPQIHECRRTRRRHRLRHHAPHPRSTLGAVDARQPCLHMLLGTLFEWGVALHGVETTKYRKGEKSMAEVRKDLRIIGKKIGKQVGKDYVVFPALTGKNWKHTLGANAVANLIRNYWSYMVIFCGHFPDGAEKFTREEYENETQPEWYLRQMLGSANFKPVASYSAPMI